MYVRLYLGEVTHRFGHNTFASRHTPIWHSENGTDVLSGSLSNRIRWRLEMSQHYHYVPTVRVYRMRLSRVISEAFILSLRLIFLPAFIVPHVRSEKNIIFGSRVSSIWVTWPARRRRAFMTTDSMPKGLERRNTSLFLIRFPPSKIGPWSFGLS